MPTLKAIHICNSHQPTLQPKIAKEYGFANPVRRPKKKCDCPTMAIRNAGESADMKVITSNKLYSKRTVLCLEIPHYADAIKIAPALNVVAHYLLKTID